MIDQPYQPGSNVIHGPDANEFDLFLTLLSGISSGVDFGQSDAYARQKIARA